jgi:hypothetical protein
MAQYYISENGVRRGPFELNQIAGEGLRPDSLVWCEGMTSWQRAESIGELAQIAYANAQQFQQYQNAAYDPYAPTQYYTAPYVQRGPSGISIASMVLGIVSVVIFCIWFLSIPCALLAIILGFVSVKDPPARGFAITGIICGFVSIAILVIVFLIAIATRIH